MIDRHNGILRIETHGLIARGHAEAEAIAKALIVLGIARDTDGVLKHDVRAHHGPVHGMTGSVDESAALFVEAVVGCPRRGAQGDRGHGFP